jgi:2-polyprenyl-6-methoxyphenol hydroxylase-like FAD-dependent oxidoreductase
MQTRTDALDVLVVGGGPTGLMMACQLARYGIGFRIIDDQPDRAYESRAIGLQARSLEIFDQLGLAEEFLSRARAAEPVVAHVNGRRIAELHFDPLVGATRYPAIYLLPQPVTEGILLDDLAARGITVARSVRLVSFVQDRDGITAELEHLITGARETARCRYLVGCDGAHSRVREVLEIPFEGATYPSEFVLADVVLPHEVPLAFYLSRRAIFLVGGLGRLTRVMGVVVDQAAHAPEDPVTIDEVNELARAAKAPIRIEHAEWMSRFRLHHRATRRYRVGRAFLAGDACHIHTPLGAQGMNTGFQDATNLAWKLEFVLHGAPSRLLDTYELERQRVGEILVRTTDRAFGLITAHRFGMGAIRELVAPFVFRIVMGSKRLRTRLVRFFSQIDIRYHPNAFVRDVDQSADDAFRSGLHAGCRVPDIEADGMRLHDLLRSTRVHVFAFGACEEPELRGLERRHFGRLTVHRFVSARRAQQAFAQFGVSQSAIYIVRPDGYVGFRSCGPSVADAAAYLENLFGAAQFVEGQPSIESATHPTR